MTLFKAFNQLLVLTHTRTHRHTGTPGKLPQFSIIFLSVGRDWSLYLLIGVIDDVILQELYRNL